MLRYLLVETQINSLTNGQERSNQPIIFIKVVQNYIIVFLLTLML